MPCMTLWQKHLNLNHIGAMNSATYETINGAGDDFGMTITHHVKGQCTERIHISRRRPDVDVGNV